MAVVVQASQDGLVGTHRLARGHHRGQQRRAQHGLAYAGVRTGDE
jgi:hypothetical protein